MKQWGLNSGYSENEEFRWKLEKQLMDLMTIKYREENLDGTVDALSSQVWVNKEWNH